MSEVPLSIEGGADLPTRRTRGPDFPTCQTNKAYA